MVWHSRKSATNRSYAFALLTAAPLPHRVADDNALHEQVYYGTSKNVKNIPTMQHTLARLSVHYISFLPKNRVLLFFL